MVNIFQCWDLLLGSKIKMGWFNAENPKYMFQNHWYYVIENKSYWITENGWQTEFKYLNWKMFP